MKICKLILISILIFSCTACTKEENIEKPIELLNKEDIIDEVYVDDSNIPLGFFLYTNGSYSNVGDNISLSWTPGLDITVLTILPTKDINVPGFYMQDLFPSYWNNLEDNKDYKLGFNLSFSTTEGDINCNILKPSDRMKELIDYIIIFLYDDVNAIRDSWYDHLEDDEVFDNTVFSSIKIYANDKTNNITSPIKLTVFAYNGEEDFDPETGNYRGKSYQEIYINKNN